MSDSPIEDYLDQLLGRLTPGRPRDARHMLNETEAHLRDTADALVAGGMASREAEQEAIARFGPAAEVALAERQRQSTPVVVIARQVFSSALLLGGIGAMAIGASGVIAAILRAFGGSRFIIDVGANRALAPSDCARWIGLDPRAHTCAQAAIADWANEVVFYRIGAGILGALAVAAFVYIRRRWSRTHRWTTLPSVIVDTIATALFASSGVVLAGLAVDAVVLSSGYGSGQWISGAVVALAMALAFGLRLVGDLRHTDFIPIS